MAITIREEQSTSSTIVGSGPLTITLGAGTQVSDTVVLIVANDFHAAADFVTPTGTAVTTWTPRHTFDGGTDDLHAKVWTGTVTTGGAQTVIGDTGHTDEERYAEVFVLSTAGVSFDTANSTDSDTASTSHVAPSVTATGADDLLICLFMAGGLAPGVTDYTVPGSMTPYTERDMTPFFTCRGASEQLSASGATGTRTATSSASVEWAAMSVLIKSGGGGGGGGGPVAVSAFFRASQAGQLWR